MAEAINSEHSNSPEVVAERAAVRKYVADLFETKIFYDVEFIVNGHEFRAHKIILARYKYFERMFSNWKEAVNKIPINGIEPEIFNIILEFVYKAQLSDWKKVLEAHAADLIAAANMFGIDGLQKKCEKYLIREKKINVETACEYAILADEHNAPQLMKTALEFIIENLEEVKKADGYKALKRHQTSMAGVVEALSPSCNMKFIRP